MITYENAVSRYLISNIQIYQFLLHMLDSWNCNTYVVRIENVIKIVFYLFTFAQIIDVLYSLNHSQSFVYIPITFSLNTIHLEADRYFYSLYLYEEKER